MAAPVITSLGGGPTAAFSVAENTSGTRALTADQSVTWSLSGADAARFQISTGSANLVFAPAWIPDFESPADQGADNVYNLTLTATNTGGETASQDLTVTVTDVTTGPPSFVKPGASNGYVSSRAENSTGTIFQSQAVDETGAPVTITLSTGDDGPLFQIDGSGNVSLRAAPDFEAPADANHDNIYRAVLTATSTTGTDTYAITLTITDVAEGLQVTTAAALSVAENTTAVATAAASNPNGGTIAWSITGGADQTLFTIDPTSGALAFASARNFEAPADVGTNNVYDVQITATTGTETAVKAVAVTVTNVNEGLSIDGGDPGAASVNENATAVLTATRTDLDGAGDTATWSISGGADQAKFAINPTTGALSFVAAPDFEAPTDADANNVYVVQIRATDGGGLSDDQIVNVTVADVANDVSIVSTAVTGSGSGGGAGATAAITQQEDRHFVASFGATTGVTYSITGGADAPRFTMGTFNGAPTLMWAGTGADFEAPADVGANNVYDVQVTATNGINSAAQDIAVTVTDRTTGPPVWLSPSLTSAVLTTSTDENALGTRAFLAVDETGAAITYSYGGPDARFFTFDAAGRTIRFTAGKDFEHPVDTDSDNVYSVDLIATSTSGTATQRLNISITDVVSEPPEIYTNGAGATAAVNVAENTTFAANVRADPQAPTVSYAITGGADQTRFAIDAATGVLSFVAAPDFEAPTDVGADNTYTVAVTASSTNGSDIQTLTVTVVDVDENGGGGSAPAPVAVPIGGTAGPDTVTGTAGIDTQSGGEGDDSIDGGGGDDILDGGAGDDSVVGGAGADNIRGLDDNDRLDGGDGPDVVNGNRGDDSVNGGAGDDTVYGGQGSDTVDGGAGDDGHVNGNLGSDVVHGGEGKDTVYGGQGDDSVYGDDGDDRLSGDLGNDVLYGGAGADRFAFARGGGQDWIADFSGTGGDRIVIAPGLTFSVGTYQGQVLITLSDGSTIGLAGVASFDPAWIGVG